MSIFTKNKSLGAFGTPLVCPYCHQVDEHYDVSKQSWKLDRWITNYLARFICKKCKRPVRYEISKYERSPGELAKMGKET